MRGPRWIGRPAWGWGPKPVDWPEPEPQVVAQPELRPCAQPERVPELAPMTHRVPHVAAFPQAVLLQAAPSRPPRPRPRPQPVRWERSAYDMHAPPIHAWLGLALAILVILIVF